MSSTKTKEILKTWKEQAKSQKIESKCKTFTDRQVELHYLSILIIINGDISSNCHEVILFNPTNDVFSESVIFWPLLFITLQILKKKRWSQMVIWKIIWKNNKDLERQFALFATKICIDNCKKKTKSNNLQMRSGTTICKKWPGTTMCKINKTIWNENLQIANVYFNVIWQSSYQYMAGILYCLEFRTVVYKVWSWSVASTSSILHPYTLH